MLKLGRHAFRQSIHMKDFPMRRLNALFALVALVCLFPATAAAQNPFVRVEAAHLGGCTVGATTSIIGAASVNETAIKATRGQVFNVSAFSLNDAPVYIKFYNDTTANIDETDTPVYRLMVPANSTATLGAGFVFNLMPGIEFTTAITMRITKGIADNDTTALDANEVLVNVCWQ